MTIKSSIKSILLTIVSLSTFAVNAGVVTQYSSVQTYQRTCPGVANASYVNDWRAAVETYYGLAPADVSADLICHFNGGNQERMYNFDGTQKAGFEFMPLGVPFTSADVGTLDIYSDFGSDGVKLDDPGGKYYADVTLDDTNLGLPQIKVLSDSNAFERNSVNAVAATEYLWTGADQTLSFTANFDFFNSGNLWGLPGVVDIYDYLYIVGFGASTDMTFDFINVFPDYGNIITEGYFSSNDESLISATETSPYTGTQTISFDVKTGDQFYLWGWTQAFGYNGGYMDASNTLTTELAVQGLTVEESKVIFATALQPAPVVSDIPEPSSIMLMCLGLLVFSIRKIR
jgi:PEP-CTERM motif